MSYSENLKLAYIHVPKTGGTSVELILEAFTDSSELKVPLVDPVWMGKHYRASDIEGVIGEEEFKNYYKFATVRDPFTLHLSEFRFLTNMNLIATFGGNSRTFHEFFDWFTEIFNGPYVTNSKLIDRPLDKLYPFFKINDLIADLNERYNRSIEPIYVNMTSVNSLNPETHCNEIIKEYGDRLPKALLIFKHEVIWLMKKCPEAVEYIIPLYEKYNVSLVDSEISSNEKSYEKHL